MPNSTLRDRARSHAFPLRQMIVLGLCRICEPIAFMSIFPYIYYMIESFHITDNDKQVALYAGLVTSAFALAECLSGPVWGRLSDRYGRKPILLSGLAGTGLSVLLFGFAPNLPTALLARALGGLLNGNIGVIQTTVAEVATHEAHQARAYATMPFVWCLGGIIGSALGGALADPVRNYPGTFARGTILDRYPYLLTNLVCAAMVLFSLSVGILFLEETHEDRRDRRDWGLDVGRWLMSRFGAGAASGTPARKGEFAGETHALVSHDESPPDYCSTAPSPTLTPTRLPPPAYQAIEASPRKSVSASDMQALLASELEEALPRAERSPRRDAGVSRAFTRQVVFNIVGFGILAYHTISAEQLLPVLFSMPEAAAPPTPPFRFTGGFALPTKTIGFILAVQGLIQMVATMLVFPHVTRRCGSLATYRLAVLSYPLLYLVVPYLTLVPAAWRMPAVYAVVVWKVTAQAFAFPSSTIMLANAAPSRRVLGTLNGVAASAASCSRAFGPTVSGSLQSSGLTLGVLGLPWWVNGLIACSGAALSLFMAEPRPVAITSEKGLDDEDEESVDAGVDADADEPARLPVIELDAARVAADGLDSAADGGPSAPSSPRLAR